MAAGPEAAIARNTIAALDRFGDRVRHLPPPPGLPDPPKG